MNKTKKYRPGKKLVVFAVLIPGLFIYLAYYQLFHHSKRVNSNIYLPGKVLNGHLSDIWSVKFSPNHQWLASGSVDSTIKVWNTVNGKLVHDLKQPQGVTSIAFVGEENLIVSSSYDSKLRLWKLPEGLLIKEFVGHTGTVWSVDVSPDGKTIASCGEDSTIKLWDVETGRIVQVFHGHTRNVWDIKFSPDGNYLASGSFDKTVRIWNTGNGKQVKVLTDHSEAIVALAFSPDGKWLTSTSDDKTVKLWNTSSWTVVHSLETPEHNQAADFSPDNKRLITAGRDKTTLGEFLQEIFGDSHYNKGVSMRLWNVVTGELLQTFSTHRNDVNDVSFSNDGKLIASASSDRSIMLWHLSK